MGPALELGTPEPQCAERGVEKLNANRLFLYIVITCMTNFCVLKHILNVESY